MGKYLIGLDFGSDSVRAVLVTESGEELATSVHNYKRWSEGLYSNAKVSQFRQHPLDYIEGIESVVCGVLKGQDASKVVGIGVDTTGSTPCLVDKNGTPLALLDEYKDNPNAMFVLWKDHTAIKEAAEINALAKSWGGIDYTMYEGGIYSSEWFWSKLLHVLRVDESVRAKAYSFVEHCDWVTSLLSGSAVKPSRCAAGHKAMWHESWNGLPSEEFLTKLDPLLKNWRSHLYSDTYTADIPVGKLSKTWADKLGLSTDVVIAGSAFDCHAGAIGAGVEAYQLVKVVGTSTCDIIVAPKVDHCVKGICGQVNGSVVPDMVGLEAGQSAFGDIYAWFKRFMSYGGEINLPALEREAAELPISEVLAIDWMNGRRTPDANQNLKGAILGINLGTTAPMVYRALAESTAYGARRIRDRFVEEGVQINSVVAIGGIAKKSKFVMQLCADIMNVEIKVCKSEQACALGAAIFGAVASGVYATTEAAMAKMSSPYDAVYTPNVENVKIYEKHYQRYLAYANAIELETMKDVQ